MRRGGHHNESSDPVLAQFTSQFQPPTGSLQINVHKAAVSWHGINVFMAKPWVFASHCYGTKVVVSGACAFPRNRLCADGDRLLSVDAVNSSCDLLAVFAFWLAPSVFSRENELLQWRLMKLNQDQQAELDRLNKVLEVAKRNGNQIFVANIEREIAAILRGEHSPLIADYLTEDERLGKRPGRLP